MEIIFSDDYSYHHTSLKLINNSSCLKLIKTAKSKEEKAKEIARCYIFEGQSRGGKMLQSALILGTK